MNAIAEIKAIYQRATRATIAIAEIKAIYQRATRATIARDLERAIALLKTLRTEEERERAAVFMDGLSQMRSEWKAGAGTGKAGR
jgi:hypothetical protein